MPTAPHYFEAVVAIMIMLTLRVTSGFPATAVTDNRIAVMVTMAGVFLATRAIISLRVWPAVGRGRQIWVRSTCDRDPSTT